MNQCPKCGTNMRWYMPQHGSPFTGDSWHCDNCGYDTNNQIVFTTNRTEAKMEWISVKDRLPEPGGEGGE